MLTACARPPSITKAPTLQVTPTLGSSASTATGTPTVPQSNAGISAFQAVIAQLSPDGHVSPEMALQAFSLAVAPLPGVKVPAGTPGDINASLAVDWVGEVWNQLGRSNQAAIEKALAAMSDPFPAQKAQSLSSSNLFLTRLQQVAAGPSCGLFQAGPGDIPGDVPPVVQAYLERMKAAASAIAAHLGRPAPLKLAVCLMSDGSLAGPALTRLFDAEHTQLGLPASCSIFLNADKIGGLDEGDIGYLMAYETFNCFKATADPTETLASYLARQIAPWVRGGTSAWVGATVAVELFGTAGDKLNEVWTSYLTEPQIQLNMRTNDAIGFFAQVNQNQPTAWDVLDNALLAGDSLDAFYAVTGRRQSFIDQWAAGYFRDASRGPDWDITGPAIPADTAEAGSIEVANGESLDMAAPAFSVSTADLSTSADITVLAGNHLRVHDGVQDLKDVHNQAFCTMEGGPDACVCPAGSAGAGRPPLPDLNVEAKLALTGVEFGGTATIQGMSLEDYCGPQPTEEPGGGVWSFVFWSPDLGDSAPPILAGYTCNGLISTWQVIYLPGDDKLQWVFDLPFAESLVVHRDKHYDLPADQLSNAQSLDYALDFALNADNKPSIIVVTGTKTESEGDQFVVLPPREFSSDAPLTLQNDSLETQLKPYPQYQHPFRAQALAECGE